ncbi:unnamed protein product [Leptosia nina]|uniref:Serum response factor-binding protein 1 n=1 Tax=Leptosia nina TaxID=320188 RepID=A0AAV1J1D5_9NEOP
MEVGAVKQAFNNEVIHLKKKLNQAKIQVIHKLTRKAKVLNEKQVPETLKEKLKRKSQAAVNEVLIIKKIKPRDIAKFIVTHNGKLIEYINKPEVDKNKACARLLTHKALQDKYKLIRDKFGNVSIDDLLMSRHERLKLKKEMKEKLKEKKNKQKEKKNGKIEVETNSSNLNISQNEGWDVVIENDNEILDNDSDTSDSDSRDGNVSNEGNTLLDEHESTEVESDKDSLPDEIDENESEMGRFVRPPPDDKDLDDDDKSKTNEIAILKEHAKMLEKAKIQNKKPDKRKENKNKNINNKIITRNFKKKEDELPLVTKVVDPFFVTASGDNYLTVAEPRAPDEVKEEHKQGNRQYRRAVMFGHVPKVKPRKDFNSKYHSHDNPKYREQESNFKHNSINKFHFNNSSDEKGKFNNQSENKVDEKPEKLHPSWEAKRKKSAILPFQGKKIVFDDS